MEYSELTAQARRATEELLQKAHLETGDLFVERNSLVLYIYYFMCNSSGKERRSETRIFSGAFLDVEGGSCYRKLEVLVFYCGKYSSVCASGISALANGFRQTLENLSNCYFVFFSFCAGRSYSVYNGNRVQRAG